MRAQSPILKKEIRGKKIRKGEKRPTRFIKLWKKLIKPAMKARFLESLFSEKRDFRRWSRPTFS